jgi:hypothetical protein
MEHGNLSDAFIDGYTKDGRNTGIDPGTGGNAPSR